ncbi:hypothetical protein [Anaerotignum sp.]|uniref:hypothetical protein n=1 Tax=Anaerotignum sp. TaxID=2039241 RepID=UPI00289BE5E2|nr:hypothetical protein [Anaerotignum sp.]
MTDEEREQLEKIKADRKLREKKHLIICKIVDEVHQECVCQNLNCEDVEALCRRIVARAKRSPIC